MFLSYTPFQACPSFSCVTASNQHTCTPFHRYGTIRDNCELSDESTHTILRLNNPSHFETDGGADFYERGSGSGSSCLDGKTRNGAAGCPGGLASTGMTLDGSLVAGMKMDGTLETGLVWF